MIKFIVGKKGSGKTKRLIEAVNNAAEKSPGNVVCVEKGPTLTYDVTHRVRLVDAELYGIGGYDAFYGFLSGICAGNYDLTDIYVDATLRIGGRNFDELTEFVDRVSALAEESHTQFTFTLSCDESELPDKIFEIGQKL